MSRAAIRYVEAILAIAKEHDAVDTVNADMIKIATAIIEHKELKVLLKSPIIHNSKKKQLLNRAFSGKHEITNNLINLLITNKRIALLEEITEKYIEFYEADKGVQVAKVTTATVLTEALEIQILSKAKCLTDKNLRIESVVDESILGGFILKIDDIQYDASVAHKLKTLKKEFTLN